MPCYLCKSKQTWYQRLDSLRTRFIRKVYTDFEESSYLCLKCFAKFDKVYRMHTKSASSASMISIQSNGSVKTVSSKSSDSVPNGSSSKENAESSGSPMLPFLSHSLTATSNFSADSTDRLVQMAAELPSLIDSTNIRRNPEILIAREAAKPAERSALRRKRARETSHPETPAGRGGANLQAVPEEDDDESIPSNRVSDDLANVGPIVKRRKQPVVYLNQDVMDIYLANTSGG